MDGERCWFCAETPSGRHGFHVGLHGGVQSTFVVIGWRDEWSVTGVDVPRCGRCRLGHSLEVLLLVVGIPPLPWALAMLADLALGTYSAPPATPSTAALITALVLPFLGWIALRHGLFGLRRWLRTPLRSPAPCREGTDGRRLALRPGPDDALRQAHPLAGVTRPCRAGG